MFEDAERLLLTLDDVVVDVHQENAFESIVNSQITACGTLLLRLSSGRLMPSCWIEVFGLAQLQVVVPSLRIQLLAFLSLCRVVRYHLNYLRDLLSQVKRAESVARIQ